MKKIICLQYLPRSHLSASLRCLNPKKFLARSTRQNNIKFKLYLNDIARNVTIYFQTASSFSMIIMIIILYSIHLNTLYPYFTIRMTNYYVKRVLYNKWVMFTQACHINLSVWSWLENLHSVKLTMKLYVCFYCCMQSVVVAKTWIECEYNAKALNLSMRLSWKHEVIAKAWTKHKVVAKAYML